MHTEPGPLLIVSLGHSMGSPLPFFYSVLQIGRPSFLQLLGPVVIHSDLYICLIWGLHSYVQLLLYPHIPLSLLTAFNYCELIYFWDGTDNLYAYINFSNPTEAKMNNKK
jgi:hypothetical protein